MKIKVWITDDGNCDVPVDEWPGEHPADGIYTIENDPPPTDLMEWAILEGHTIHICKEED